MIRGVTRKESIPTHPESVTKLSGLVSQTSQDISTPQQQTNPSGHDGELRPPMGSPTPHPAQGSPTTLIFVLLFIGIIFGSILNMYLNIIYVKMLDLNLKM